MTNPSPVWANQVGQINQRLLRSDMSRASEVTFGVFASEGHSLAVAQDVVDDFQANFNANIGVNMDSQVAILPPTIRLGNANTTPLEATAAGAAIAGGSAGTFMPPNVALLAKKNTGISGRSNRGRTYFPFLLPTSTVSENGTISGAELTAITTAFAAFLAQMATDLSPMIILQKNWNITQAQHDATGAPRYLIDIEQGPSVLTFQPESVIATQRRRLDR